MKNKKCLFSVISSSHIIGFEVFCKSLKRTNPWVEAAELEILLISIDLSDYEKEKCEKNYPFITWIEPPDKPTSFSKDGAAIGDSAFYKLFPFSVEDYDLVISIDCADMVFMGNIAQLFSYDVDIGMVQGWTPVRKWQQFNGGLVLLNKTYRNKDIYNKLISHPTTAMFDQDILNNFFKNKISQLPVKFNFSKRMIECKEVNIKDAAIIHYVGEKPWQEYPDKDKYIEVEKKWHEYAL